MDQTAPRKIPLIAQRVARSRCLGSVLAPLAALLSVALTSGKAMADVAALTSQLQVQDANAYLYEQPDRDSPVLRRLFAGELVVPVATVTAKSGLQWVKLQLGKGRIGYLPKEQLGPLGPLPDEVFETNELARNHRPMGIGLLAMGPLHNGGAISLRYLPLSRLGATFSAGSILKGTEMVGTGMTFGILSLVALSNFSPFVEGGFSRLSAHAENSTLRVSAFYLTAGLEWMADWGLFVNAGLTYIRGLDAEVTWELEVAERDELELESYPLFEDAKGGALQALRPMVKLGYGF